MSEGECIELLNSLPRDDKPDYSVLVVLAFLNDNGYGEIADCFAMALDREAEL